MLLRLFRFVLLLIFLDLHIFIFLHISFVSILLFSFCIILFSSYPFSNCFIFKRKKATYFRFLNSPKIHSFFSMFIYLFIKFYDIYIYIYTASRLSRFTICLSPLSFAVYILYQLFFICQQIFSFLFSYPRYCFISYCTSPR